MNRLMLMSIVSISRQSCWFSATRRIIHYPLMSYGLWPQASIHDASGDTSGGLDEARPSHSSSSRLDKTDHVVSRGKWA